MLGVNEVYNWQCLKSIRVMYLNISCSQAELLSIAEFSPHWYRRPFCLLMREVLHTLTVDMHAFQVNT